jgi:hypothetical protein
MLRAWECDSEQSLLCAPTLSPEQPLACSPRCVCVYSHSCLLSHHPDVTVQNPATLLHCSPPPVEVDLTVEPWGDSIKNGGWERLLQQLWSVPALSTLRDAGSPTDSVEVWRQLAATDDASRAKPTEDHFERIDTKAPRARWADVQALGVASEAVLVVRLPSADPVLSVAPNATLQDGVDGNGE